MLWVYICAYDNMNRPVAQEIPRVRNSGCGVSEQQWHDHALQDDVGRGRGQQVSVLGNGRLSGSRVALRL